MSLCDRNNTASVTDDGSAGQARKLSKGATNITASLSTSSPVSILQQWKLDAKGAMEDAYANYVLGDDAGEAARLVLVATPSDDYHNGNGNHSNSKHHHSQNGNSRSVGSKSHSGRGGSINRNGGTGGGGGSNPYHSPPSLLQAANSRKPHHSFVSCGVTFVEINGRAYVQALEESSAAFKAGVLPQDCVQYAAVLAKEWEEPLDGDFAAISQQALEREDKGQRITFTELKRVLLHGSGIIDASDPLASVMGPLQQQPVPTTIRIGKVKNMCGPTTACTTGGMEDCEEQDEETNAQQDRQRRASTSSPLVLGDDPRPVVLVFRRTRQRPPRVWNVWPNYRLDDECDVACQILESLTVVSSSSATKTSHQDKKNGRRRKKRQSRHAQSDEEETTDEDSFDNETTMLYMLRDKHNAIEEMNVEASTIRGMIQKAVGLAFVRSNKVVFGLSLHGGSGIVISRLSDGTWSAPSCIGMLGMGLGLQVGLEVANYIFILQTKEALEHFQRGGSFTLGANVGAAFAGMGREAIGAASVSSALCGMSSSVPVIKEDEYTFEDGGADDRPGAKPLTESSSVAPIVAYAKSEGLYIGVSLEGSRIFTREELNARAYKFSSHNNKSVTAQDILTGKVVQRPSEGEKLYALLHAVEYTHDITSLPPLPNTKLLFDGSKKDGGNWTKPWNASSPPYMESGNDDNDLDKVLMQEDIDEFCEKFQEFLFGGVTVLRIAPHKRERRTLWLYAPQEGSLRLGFVSKLFSATSRTTHLSTSLIQDIPKAGSGGEGGGGGSTISDMEGDEVTLDSALLDNQSLLTTTGTLREKVELSKKLSIDIIDILSLSQNLPEKLKLRSQSERRRIISLETLDTQITFACRSVEETRLLYCGLKVLLEKESSRLGIRGGQGKYNKNGRNIPSALKSKKKSPKQYQASRHSSGYGSSEIDDTEEQGYQSQSYPSVGADNLPEGWKSWGRLPGRSYMREQAASVDDGYPTYVHGQLLVRDLCKNVHLPLPLPLCRVLLLDSSSPVVSKWEQDRGDRDFERTPWTFPPATPREMEQFQSEHQLIASGSMCGAHRTISYERYRNGQIVRLSETHIVDSDDSEKLAFQVTERLPRRGFSIKVKILLRAVDNGNACEATVLGEIRPVGKNMSDPAAVHKAFMLVLDELRNRYGTDSVGLLAGFMSVVENMPKGEKRRSQTNRFSNHWEEKKESDYVKNDKTSIVKFEDVMNADQNLGVADTPDSKFAQERRPSTPSPKDVAEGKYKSRKVKTKLPPVDDTFDSPSSDPVTIEVKPLPKIRLSLMPSPREEDEEDLDEEGEPKSKAKKSSSPAKSKSKSSKRSSWIKNNRNSKSKASSD